MLRVASGIARRASDFVRQPASPGRARVKAVLLTAVSSGAAKVVTTATALVSAPLTLNYLGSERFGLWMTVSSLVVFLSFADLGIGNGLLNAVATGHGRNDSREVRRAISSAAALLSAIAALIITLFALSYPFVPWARLVNAHGELGSAEAGPTLAIFIVCTALSIPAGIVLRIQLGVQRGFESSAWQAGGSVLGLALVLVAIAAKAGLPWLVAAMAGGPLLATLVNGVVFLGVRRPDLRPAREDVSWPLARALTGSGLLFVVMQLSSALAFGSDNLIIARTLGPSAVAGYALACRLFAIVQQANHMIVGPLWPAYREAIARGDNSWALLYFKRSMFLSIAMTATLGLGLALCGPQIIRWWVGNELEIPSLLFLALAVWVLVESVGVTASMFLYATGSVASLAAVSAVFSVVCVIARVWYVRKIGVLGMPVATILCYCALALLPATFIVRTRLARLLR
jgi:O-antigen/teichoic acid export membrane protein